MLAATYDPQAISNDAFDVDNHTNGTTNKVYTATEKTKLAGVASGATANDTDANLKNRANHTGTQTASTISDFSTAADARIANAAGSTVASLSGGKVPTSQLPAVSLTSVQTAASEVAQLALTTQEGDVVVRTDENKTYMRNSGTAGDMTDFTLLNTPADAVTSVNGDTGVVVLDKTDVGLGNVTNNAQYYPGGTDVAIADGGTGASTKAGGFDALSPMTASGDIIYGGASGTGTRLAKGSDTQVLTLASGVPTWATPAAGGGQTVVTKVVAASGGDYTTLGAAIAAASAGWVIQVKDATTESGAITSALNNLTIIGSNRTTSLVDLSSNLLTLSGTGITLTNLGFTVTTGGVVLSGANALYRNGYISTTGIPTANHILMSGADPRLEGFYYEYTSATSLGGKTPILVSGANARVAGCRLYTNGLTAGGNLLNATGAGAVIASSNFKCITSGQTVALRIAGQYSLVSNCYVEGVNNVNANGITTVNQDISITNCTIKGWGVGIFSTASATNLSITNCNFNIPSSGGCGFQNPNALNVATFTGNNFIGAGASSSVGLKFNSSINRDVTVTGNTFYGLSAGITSGTNTGQSTGMSITSNAFIFCTTNHTVNATYHNVNVWGNSGLSHKDEVEIITMKNTSGGTVNYGSCVILNVSSGDALEFTTTTTASDPLVYGVLGDDIANNASGSVVLQGSAAGNLVRVDGSGTSIAAGDFITTSTTAGIGVKATTGQTAYAIALASATTSTRIKALLIRPRLI